MARYEPEKELKEVLDTMLTSGWYETAEDVGEDAIETVKGWMKANEDDRPAPFRAATYGTIYINPPQ